MRAMALSELWAMVESTMSVIKEGRIAGCVQEMDEALENAQVTISTLMAVVLNKSRDNEDSEKKVEELSEKVAQYSRWWNESEEKVRKSEDKLAVIRQMLDIMK